MREGGNKERRSSNFDTFVAEDTLSDNGVGSAVLNSATQLKTCRIEK